MYFNKKETEANTLQAEIDGIDKQMRPNGIRAVWAK